MLHVSSVVKIISITTISASEHQAEAHGKGIWILKSTLQTEFEALHTNSSDGTLFHFARIQMHTSFTNSKKDSDLYILNCSGIFMEENSFGQSTS